MFWILSAPPNPTKQETVTKLRDKIGSKSNELAEILPFSLPDFKVGTLDMFVVLSDDLVKADATFESVTMKIGDNLRTLLNNDLDQWRNNLSVSDKSIDQFLKAFQWNTMKYRTDKSLRELTDLISQVNINSKAMQRNSPKSTQQEVNSIETLMKNKMQAYSTKEYFVLDSEYLITILVALPKRITEDDEYALYAVTLFQRVVDEFTQKAREHMLVFLVRDFKRNEQQMAMEKKALTETGAAEKEQWTTLLRLCKTNFGEVFSCWIHIKVLRVYVESILRYGLPPDFQPMVIKLKPKQNEKKLKDAINLHYAKLGGAANTSSNAADEALEENVQLLLGDKDYCPAVLFGINAFWVDSNK
ncbi:hypothetical protein BC830DRAFT_1162317 [Chytriomyces sp. MP71]|nr:hypothetical protein BC830DRAFT_1162317 [Chytriomyces sp. MP71]